VWKVLVHEVLLQEVLVQEVLVQRENDGWYHCPPATQAMCVQRAGSINTGAQQ